MKYVATFAHIAVPPHSRALSLGNPEGIDFAWLSGKAVYLLNHLKRNLATMYRRHENFEANHD